MSPSKPHLTTDEIARAFAGEPGKGVPPILSPEQLAKVLGKSVKTVYDWIAMGRLDGAFRKRGKHHLIWRDRAIAILFDGKEWKSCPKKN